MTRRVLTGVLVAAVVTASPSQGQSALGRSPNLRPVWTREAGAAAIRLAHRFEFLAGGDELLSFPTLTVGAGLGRRISAGLDFTSNSEIVATNLGGNETQFWVGWAPLTAERVGIDATLAWNTAAQSLDGALTGTFRFGALSLVAEGRAFSDQGGAGAAALAATGAVVWRLTPMLELSGDLGQTLSPDRAPSVWSAGVAVAIPGSPHTLSLHATNGAATTLQGATQRQVLGLQRTRFGFAFTIPLGSASSWARIFRRDGGEAADLPEGADVVVAMRQITLAPREVRIRAGQSVAWANHDPLVHTITADDRSWDSGEVQPGANFVRRFDLPGRYAYHCTPHPQMRGVVVVEP